MAVMDGFFRVRNNERVNLESIPEVSFDTLRRSMIAAIDSGARISAMPVRQVTGKARLQILSVLGFPETAELGILA
ncbi:MAG: hypothetical protein Q8P24_13720, partial [Desulfobacterales bacterium]|nr:hypothetical protein [Desulfobacterales bacterium]